MFSCTVVVLSRCFVSSQTPLPSFLSPLSLFFPSFLSFPVPFSVRAGLAGRAWRVLRRRRCLLPSYLGIATSKWRHRLARLLVTSVRDNVATRFCHVIEGVSPNQQHGVGRQHQQHETTRRGLSGLVCPSRTCERGGEGYCVKEGGGGEGEREKERALGRPLCHSPRH